MALHRMSLSRQTEERAQMDLENVLGNCRVGYWCLEVQSVLKMMIGHGHGGWDEWVYSELRGLAEAADQPKEMETHR